MGVHENLTGAQRAARYRAAKRAQGLRLKQIWVPDLRDPMVLARIELGIGAFNASKEEAEYNRRLTQHSLAQCVALARSSQVNTKLCSACGL